MDNVISYVPLEITEILQVRAFRVQQVKKSIEESVYKYVLLEMLGINKEIANHVQLVNKLTGENVSMYAILEKLEVLKEIVNNVHQIDNISMVCVGVFALLEVLEIIQAYVYLVQKQTNKFSMENVSINVTLEILETFKVAVNNAQSVKKFIEENASICVNLELFVNLLEFVNNVQQDNNHTVKDVWIYVLFTNIEMLQVHADHAIIRIRLFIKANVLMHAGQEK